MVIDMLFEDPWTKSFKQSLKNYDYIKIRTQRLQGLVLNVFCLRKHVTHLRYIEATYTRTGLGGMWVSNNYLKLLLTILINNLTSKTFYKLEFSMFFICNIEISRERVVLNNNMRSNNF